MNQSDIFAELLAVNEELDGRFDSPYEWMRSSLMVVGLGLCEPEKPGEYFCSPKNTRQFALTGGDGIHYSFLLLPDAPLKEGPVVATYPANPDTQNVIVGENLYEFLCLGCRCGYEMLPYGTRFRSYRDA